LLRELIRRFSELPVEYAEEGPDGRLAQVVLDQLAAAPQVDLMLPLPLDPRLRQIYRSLELHPEQPTTLGDWSRKLAVSEKTLSRLFLRDTGLTFRAWRQRLRLLGALPALEQGERVTDVALACGYESTSAFINAFRQLFDATPGEFFR
jgi:AraC-like DNA-binding protein